ncbi:MAG: two-component system sensor histidine kinase CreC, partial [bacterium]|nr:two-component system sensor histidine kinase CreC [bacterium]
GDTAAYLATYATPTAAGEDWVKKLAGLPPGTEVLRVFACGPDDRVIFDAAGRDVGQTYAREMYGGGKIASENYSVPNVAVVGNELRVFAPVRFNKELVGWVGVGRPLATMAEGISSARWRLVWMSGSIALLMMAAGWWIAARLTRSLERLTVYAQNVRDGRAVRPPPSRATEIAALAKAFEEMRDALEGRQHAERYTQALAHEVKAPLAAIRGAAELLDEDMPAEQRRKFMANIRGESARIQQIVDRLLELSSLEARKALGQAGPVEAGALLTEVTALMQPAFAAGRVTLTGEGAAATLHGERVLLREALVNLLQNALDFSPAGSEVVVRCAAAAGRVNFSVEDHGPGVPDYALARVFERFYSLPRPGTERKSTGLGLALVREIAHLHGGDATLANRPTGGARAEFWVPIKAS